MRRSSENLKFKIDKQSRFYSRCDIKIAIKERGGGRMERCLKIIGVDMAKNDLRTTS